jgi:ABC-type polysaccharide/polyol phosphate transport system ATPase subunit
LLTTSNGEQRVKGSLASTNLAIGLAGVSVRYRMPSERITTLKEQIIRRITRRNVKYQEFCALSNINLKILRGQSVALIGRNGAGKSTLLKVIARVQNPTTGRVWVRGNVAPLIELGAGFHHELTGRENIFLNGAMLGFSRAQMLRKFDSIVEFSELGTFIDSPLRTYSSGMIARLGFSIAADADPDILIIDEALAVGDEAFQHKCLERMFSFRDQGVTILYVTHALDSIHELCQQAIWIDEGQIRFSGETQLAVELYRESLEVGSNMSILQKRRVIQAEPRKAQITQPIPQLEE